jgi:Flp pilus assembly protein TadD
LRWAPWSATGRRIEAETLLASGDLVGARRSFRRAVAADPRNWELWFALAQVTSGREHSVAIARAEELNPQSPDIRAYLRAAGTS